MLDTPTMIVVALLCAGAYLIGWWTGFDESRVPSQYRLDRRSKFYERLAEIERRAREVDRQLESEIADRKVTRCGRQLHHREGTALTVVVGPPPPGQGCQRCVR